MSINWNGWNLNWNQKKIQKSLKELEDMKKDSINQIVVIATKNYLEEKEFQIVFLYCLLGKDGRPVESYDVTSLHQARMVTRLSLCSLINAAEKGNFKITRRRDKKEFLISWGIIHHECFEIRQMKRKEEQKRT